MWRWDSRWDGWPAGPFASTQPRLTASYSSSGSLSSALLLVLAAGVYVGLGIAHEDTSGTGLDVALAIGFFVVASAVTTWEPSMALTVLALAWVGHSFVDLAHMVNLLPASIVPVWSSESLCDL